MKTPAGTGDPSTSTTPSTPKTPKPETGKATDGSREIPSTLEGTPPYWEDRRKRIADAAYYKAELRGFTPGAEESDWLEAEKEIGGEDEPGKLRPEDNAFPTPK